MEVARVEEGNRITHRNGPAVGGRLEKAGMSSNRREAPSRGEAPPEGGVERMGRVVIAAFSERIKVSGTVFAALVSGP